MLNVNTIKEHTDEIVDRALAAFSITQVPDCEIREISSYISIRKDILAKAIPQWDVPMRMGGVLAIALLQKVKAQFDFNYYSPIKYELTESDIEYIVTAKFFVD